jgi:hypothetical protein
MNGTAAAAITAAVALALLAAACGSPSSSGSEVAATAPVLRENLSATTPVAATLGYAGSYTVSGQGVGTLTGLPQPGQVISQGQVLYQTGNLSPVVLLYGSVPDWRTMSEGIAGADVSQLNHDVVTLGDARSSQISLLGWDTCSSETAYGVQQLEEHLGVSGVWARTAGDFG